LESHQEAFKTWLAANRQTLEQGDEEATERARKLWPWDGNGDLDCIIT
jgi:hypothetical protein